MRTVKTGTSSQNDDFFLLKKKTIGKAFAISSELGLAGESDNVDAHPRQLKIY